MPTRASFVFVYGHVASKSKAGIRIALAIATTHVCDFRTARLWNVRTKSFSAAQASGSQAEAAVWAIGSLAAVFCEADGVNSQNYRHNQS